MRIYIFLFFFVCFNITVPAQSFSPTGAVWRYSFATGGPFVGYVKIHYDHDTIIASQTCKVLYKHLYGYDYMASSFTNFAMSKERIYEAGSVVYVWNNSSFDTLFNFDAAIGDSWKNSKGNLMTTIDTNAFVSVVDTGSRIINSELLKWLKVDINCPMYPFTYSDTIFEKIGNVNSYFLSSDGCSAILDGNEGGPFRCYYDPSFGTYNRTTVVCDFIIGTKEINQTSFFKLYPNPSNDQLSIEAGGKNISKIKIFNALGQTVLTMSNEPTNLVNINIRQLDKGIYMVQTYVDNNLTIQTFIKE